MKKLETYKKEIVRQTVKTDTKINEFGIYYDINYITSFQITNTMYVKFRIIERINLSKLIEIKQTLIKKYRKLNFMFIIENNIFIVSFEKKKQ